MSRSSASTPVLVPGRGQGSWLEENHQCRMPENPEENKSAAKRRKEELRTSPAFPVTRAEGLPTGQGNSFSSFTGRQPGQARFTPLGRLSTPAPTLVQATASLPQREPQGDGTGWHPWGELMASGLARDLPSPGWTYRMLLGRGGKAPSQHDVNVRA